MPEPILYALILRDLMQAAAKQAKSREPATSMRRSRCLGIREYRTHVTIHKLKLNQENGLMETSELFELPFTDAHDQGIVGLLPEDAARIVKVIERVNANADVA